MKKNNFGIICFDKKYDTSLYNNYRLALENYFLINKFCDIKCTNDLDRIDYIFIIDEHMTREIWMHKKFIDFVNEKKIKVVVFNFEKIFNSVFKSNLLFQKELEKFENLYQFPSDVDDANSPAVAEDSCTVIHGANNTGNRNVEPFRNTDKRVTIYLAKQFNVFEKLSLLLIIDEKYFW